MTEQNDIAVIMCTWKRIERFENTLESLTLQSNKDFTFFVCNNNSQIVDDINKISKRYENKIKIIIRHFSINIGGFARFLVAKDIAKSFNKIIFIDDDQNFSNNMVEIFNQFYEANSIKSRWAFRLMSDDYANRYQVLESNMNVHYCGTGGMIVPSALFDCDKLYEIPNEYQFVEDLWLCFVGNYYLNYSLKSIKDGFINQIVDNKDQSTMDFLVVKRKFLKYLINEREWKILKT